MAPNANCGVSAPTAGRRAGSSFLKSKVPPGSRHVTGGQNDLYIYSPRLPTFSAAVEECVCCAGDTLWMHSALFGYPSFFVWSDRAGATSHKLAAQDQVRTFPQKHPRCETDKFDFVLKQMRSLRHSLACKLMQFQLHDVQNANHQGLLALLLGARSY